jgi:hypothetical protein
MQPTDITYTSNNEQFSNNGKNNELVHLSNNENNIIVTDHPVNTYSENNEIKGSLNNCSNSSSVLDSSHKEEIKSLIDNQGSNSNNITFDENQTARNHNTSKDESRQSLVDTDLINNEDTDSIFVNNDTSLHDSPKVKTDDIN